MDTADAIIHAFVGEKKKSYQIFTNQSVSEVTDLDFEKKICKKGESFDKCNCIDHKIKTGVPHDAAAQVNSEAILRLVKEPGMIQVEFNKLQAKSHSIKMIHQTKSLTNSFDNGSSYKDCGICSVPFHCTLENITECLSVGCMINSLLVDIWIRLLTT